MNTLTQSEPRTTMEQDHIYTHRSETSINVLPSTYHISIIFLHLLFVLFLVSSEAMLRSFGLVNILCNEYSMKI